MKILKAALMVLWAGCFCACSLLPSPAFLKEDPGANPEPKPLLVNVIALLPVESITADTKATKMLRAKLGDELRFKGYPPLDAEVIDNKLKSLSGEKEITNSSAIPPRVVEELLGADGVMYCSFQESGKTSRFFYSPVTVSVRCVLRRAKTGETIWSAQSRSTSRSFDVRHSKIHMESRGNLEEAMEEAVAGVMETLPYGPKLRS
ncbi:MAG: DUF799 family lipoprotein [Deltaproteobacteria bacterium]|nr:DUF799 family lipoprotein [Deltaproteobacteria bacterium]